MGASMPKLSLNEFEDVQIRFLTNFLLVKKQTPHALPLNPVKKIFVPTKIIAMEMVASYICIKRTLLSTSQDCMVLKTHEENFVYLDWMQNMK